MLAAAIGTSSEAAAEAQSSWLVEEQPSPPENDAQAIIHARSRDQQRAAAESKLRCAPFRYRLVTPDI